jgi:RNA polymerase sigma factor (TIGR02999 family)
VSVLTQILDRAEAGDPNAAQELLPHVYEELRHLAAAKMAHEAPGQTLQATALVHEAWLRLTGSDHARWRDRRHFFGAAAEAMRRILIDKARRKGRVRHGAHFERVDLEEVDVASETDAEILLHLDEALSQLAAEDPVKAELIKLRFYVGLSIADAGAMLGLSESTAKRYWNYSRAWLHQALTTKK